MLTRRDFVRTSLRDASLLALAPAVPGFLAATARATAPLADGRVLVVIQLDGGNDGINTVVPYKDDGYTKNRKDLRLDAAKLLKVNDSTGLHPSMAGAAKLLERGRLAIVQGVGYPNPSRSHFRSMEIWQTARPDPEESGGPGWLGRAWDDRLSAGDLSGTYFVGEGQPPAALVGRRSFPATLGRLGDLALEGKTDARVSVPGSATGNDLLGFVRRTALDAYAAADRVAERTRAGRSAAEDSGRGLRGRLEVIARLLKSGSRARVYYTQQGSYDTHAGQLQAHANLLFELSESLKGFQEDLEASSLADRVLVLCFSEFGRRVAENASSGTDHGTAGPVILVGDQVRPGLIGPTPSLLDLDDGDLKMALDFRRIYAAVLEDWLGVPSATALGGRFVPLPLVSHKSAHATDLPPGPETRTSTSARS
jgi:uncharacterized protein (DUF1501 family)